MSPTSALPRGRCCAGSILSDGSRRPEKSRPPRGDAGAQRFDPNKKKNAGALFVRHLLRLSVSSSSLSLSVSFDRRAPALSSLSQPPPLPARPPSWINTP